MKRLARLRLAPAGDEVQRRQLRRRGFVLHAPVFAGRVAGGAAEGFVFGRATPVELEFEQVELSK